MKEFEILLDKRWVLKSEDKDIYYKVRDAIGDIRRFATDKMGCQVIENSLLVKLEKIPAIPESCMGIEDFTSQEEYAFICILLMFLEDKDAEDQFILSQLTEYIASNMPQGTVDWTLYNSRRRLIKVLRYAASQGIIRVTDGADEVFMDEQTGEVLYENTGASRYFMRNFSRDIMTYGSPSDFMESDWFEMDEDRGIARRHRVYKRLLFSIGMYQDSGSPEDFEYLKYYGRRLSEDLEQNFDCRVHIHKGSAFILTGEDCHIGKAFPGNNAISDILLLCCGKIRKKVEEGSWKTEKDDKIIVDKFEFEELIRSFKREQGSGFTKSYRQMPEGEFVGEIMRELEEWTFIRLNEKDRQVIIYPSAGKMEGHYPDDYVTKEED
jgi:uncharacterized protein (TIGR02678 family)